MADPTAEAARNLFKTLHTGMAVSLDMWEEIARLMRPTRLGFLSQHNPGADLTQWMYDSTALQSSVDWTDVVHFALANPFTRFFGVEVDGVERDDLPSSITDWEQDVSEAMAKDIGASNFTESTNELLLDIGLFGNAVPMVEQVPDKKFEIDFRALHLRDCAPLVGGYGTIRTTFYKPMLTIRQIVDQFAIDEWNAQDMPAVKARIGTAAYSRLEAGEWGHEIECLNMIFPRPIKDQKIGKDGTAQPEGRPFGNLWINNADGHVLRLGGYYEQPRFWGRYRKRTDDPLGGGIGELALPDVQQLNDMKRLQAAAADKEVDPYHYQEGDNFMGDMDMRARGLVTVKKLDKMLIPQPRYAVVANMTKEELIQSIKALWMADELKLPPREEVGQMTAYEIAKRVERIFQIMGPTIHRMSREMFAPMLERVYGLMDRAGRLPDMPDELIELAESNDAAKLNFRFMGASAKAQIGEEVAALDDHFTWVANAATVDPNVLDTINMDGHAKKRAELVGYPADLMNDEDKIKEIRDQREKMKQAMQQAAVAKDAGAAAASVSKAVGPEKAMQVLEGGQA